MLTLFLELATLLFFALAAAHAARRHGRFGVLLIGFLLLLGFLRENFVTLERLLYGYGDLHLELGAAPLIGAIIWPYSIYVACCWAERMSGVDLVPGLTRGPFLALVALFMVSLVGFYEPLLHRVGMARWEEGTRAIAHTPWIALVGYPSLAVPGVALCGALIRRTSGWRLAAGLAVGAAALAVVHARSLQALKDGLGW
ncbi:MAG: hypothetical protein AAFY88_27030 [Acidobacteriota bacterium]